MELHELLNTDFAGNSVLKWATAVAVVLITFFGLEILHRLILKKVKRLALKRDGAAIVEAILSSVRNDLLLALAISAGSQVLTLHHKVETIFDRVGILALLFSVGFMLVAGFSEWLGRRTRESMGTSIENLGVMGFGVRVVVWTVLFLVGLDNFGVNISALLAGLGVGGIAIALATQNILGDIFASMSIILDKPFVVGDSITVGDFSGSVEKIGLKTTRLRSTGGEQLIFSNTDLLNSRVRNFKRMEERRISFKIGVPYETPRDKLPGLPEVIKKVIGSVPDVRFDRCHLQCLNTSSIDFETVYWITRPDYARYMDAQQKIYLGLIEEFEKIGVGFAYPTSVQYAAPLKQN